VLAATTIAFRRYSNWWGVAWGSLGFCLWDDLNTEFFVEPRDLLRFESLSIPGGRWMTRLW